MDKVGFKVGLALGLVSGALAVGALADVPEKQVVHDVKVIRVPEVITKKVPGPTKYVTMPYPEACEDVGVMVRRAFRLSQSMGRLAEQISNRALNELQGHTAMDEHAVLVRDIEYIKNRSDGITRRMYAWHDYGDMVQFYLDKCNDDIEAGKKGLDSAEEE